MKFSYKQRGGAPVGHIAELDAIEAASIIYLRLWADGPDAQRQVWNEFATTLGPDRGRRTLETFEELCVLCAQHARRPMMRHAVRCKCVGADESCFANFIATAVEGPREAAMLIATLMVRPDVAPLITSLAVEFGLALKQMRLPAPGTFAAETHLAKATLH